MAKELIVLDPTEVAIARTEVNLDSGPFRVREEGLDWGDAAIAAYMAEAAQGEVPVDFRVPNRHVKIPLIVQSATGPTVTYAAAQTLIQQKIGFLQREGGWLKRETKDGRKLYLDIVNATLGMGGGSGQALYDFDGTVTLDLEAIPDFYGDEITLSTHSETTLPELVWTETGIKGAWPGRVRVLVDELQGVDQRGLIVAFRSRYYDSAATARLAYEAEALTPLDTAAIATVTGASGGGANNAIQHTNLSTLWTPVLSTQILSGGAHMTHVGTYQVMARLRSPDGSAVQARFLSDVGDLILPEENDPWTFPTASQFYDADLGQIRLDKVPIGSHRWKGVIQARGTVGGEDIQIDRIWFVPLDESFTKVTAPPSVEVGLAGYSARDEFNQSAGALTGKTAATGGVWVGAGDAVDLAVETTGHTAERSDVNDLSNTGRYAASGVAAFASQVVRVDAKQGIWGGTPITSVSLRAGVMARYVDANNWFMANIKGSNFLGNHNNWSVEVRKRVAGTVTVVDIDPFPTGAHGDATFYTLQVAVDAGGRWQAWFVLAGASLGEPLLTGQDDVLATGGTLASGKPGFYDELSLSGVSTMTRNYDNFAAWAPPADAAVFASQTADIGTQGAFREDAAGVAYGPITRPLDMLPRIPVSGAEARTIEAFVKGSRGEFDQLADTGIDDIRGQIKYRPCWMFVAGT